MNNVISTIAEKAKGMAINAVPTLFMPDPPPEITPKPPLPLFVVPGALNKGAAVLASSVSKRGSANSGHEGKAPTLPSAADSTSATPTPPASKAKGGGAIVEDAQAPKGNSSAPESVPKAEGIGNGIEATINGVEKSGKLEQKRNAEIKGQKALDSEKSAEIARQELEQSKLKEIEAKGNFEEASSKATELEKLHAEAAGSAQSVGDHIEGQKLAIDASNAQHSATLAEQSLQQSIDKRLIDQESARLASNEASILRSEADNAARGVGAAGLIGKAAKAAGFLGDAYRVKTGYDEYTSHIEQGNDRAASGAIGATAGDIAGGAAGCGVGAFLGAKAGAFLAPFTAGASIPIAAGIGCLGVGYFGADIGDQAGRKIGERLHDPRPNPTPPRHIPDAIGNRNQDREKFGLTPFER